MAGSPTTLTACTSCHNDPPDSAVPAGDTHPNRQGAHSTHVALPNVAGGGDCSACHNLAGSGSLTHWYVDPNEPADVLVLGTYAALSGGPASYDAVAQTCGGVSCHGGQATPAWPAGTLDVDTQCLSCHGSDQSAPPQFNDFRNSNSHQHDFHLARRVPPQLDPTRPDITCTDCHNTAALASLHFTNLEDPALGGQAQSSIGGGATRIDHGTYNPLSGSCAPQCHSQKNW
jgi:predicted CxxxxCH...CXXCH cytochrome family protein